MVASPVSAVLLQIFEEAFAARHYQKGIPFLKTTEQHCRNVVEVILRTGDYLEMTITVLNAMPFYWGVSCIDIWEAAINNEIVDEVGADRSSNYLATDSLKEIKNI